MQQVTKLPKKLPLSTRLAYGFGCAAYGIKDNAFQYFLLLFYSQVVGLNATLVGLALLIALVFDSISDPIVGYWSDNFRSERFGRRHPFLYAAIIPVTASFFLVWHPPEGWGQWQLFWYLVVTAIIIRTFITLYETPSSAMTPELTTDYDERSTLVSFRLYFAWTGGTLTAVLMYVFVFSAFTTEAYPDGRFNPDAFAFYGFMAASVMFLAMVVSSVGTHKYIPALPKAQKRHLSREVIFNDFKETLTDIDFIRLFIAAMFGAVATGLSASLTFYFLTYFWLFTPEQMGLITLGTLVSAVIGAVLAPIVSKKWGKKQGAMIVGLIAFIGSPTPMVLRLFGILPDADWVYFFVVCASIIDIGLIVCFQTLFQSMAADLVEKNQVKTGRRAEGLIAAAITFIRKSSQGLGILSASILLAIVQFPTGADVSEVSRETVANLVMFYVPTILSFWMLMVFFVSRFKIDKQAHLANLAKLAKEGQR